MQLLRRGIIILKRTLRGPVKVASLANAGPSFTQIEYGPPTARLITSTVPQASVDHDYPGLVRCAPEQAKGALATTAE
jgi:hypothetical protein